MKPTDQPAKRNERATSTRQAAPAASTPNATAVLTLPIESLLSRLSYCALFLLVLDILVVLSYVLGFSFTQAIKFYFDREANPSKYFSTLLHVVVYEPSGKLSWFRMVLTTTSLEPWVDLLRLRLN